MTLLLNAVAHSLGFDTGSNGEGHRQRKRDDADGEASCQIREELRGGVAAKAVKEFRTRE